MKTYKLTIAHTSDVHGYIMPYSYADNLNAPLGLSKVQEITKNIPNKLLIDTGDFLQGSALATYIAEQNPQVHPFSSILNKMKYDYFIVGNHDFNYGSDYLLNFEQNLDATILSSNIYKETRVFKPYDIIQLENGPKIAIIGLTTHYIPNWENPKNIDGFTFKHELEELDNILESIEDVDYRIVAYHGGFNKDLETDLPNPNETGENSGSEMFQRNIDCLLTGHQHQSVAGVKNNIIYSQPGCNAAQVNIVDIEFEYTDKWRVKSQDVKQVPVGDDYDNQITELVKVEEKSTQEWLDVPIGTLIDGDCFITDPLLDRLNKSPLVTLINDAQLDISNADIAITSLGNTVKGFRKDITIRDIISTYIYPNTLVVMELDAKTIIEALEKNANFFTLNDGVEINPEYLYPKKELYNYDMFDGIEYTINLKKPMGSRIENILFKGKPFDMNRTYTVVMNNYRAAGGGNFTMFKQQPIVKTIEKDMVEILSNYISNKKEVSLNQVSNITIIK